jgi:two-component system CitB family sensor kinase
MKKRMAGSARINDFMKLSHISLNHRIFFLIILIIVISVSIETFFIKQYMQNSIIEKEGADILSVAQVMAKDQRIINAFNLPDPASVIQPIAEQIKLATGTSFVVVMNMSAVRYSHQKPDRIGKPFMGGDEVQALKGATYVSNATGTLGVS